jgi:hypothetical protein
VADRPRLFVTRWVLLLLVASEAAGLPEVSRQRLHNLLFLSFASSRYYGIEPLRQRAQRTPQGPYYRLAHVALGGLVLGGMVSISNFKAYPAARNLQFEGVFRPTLVGLKVARNLRETITGARLYHFLLDLCLAAAATTAPKINIELALSAVDLEDAEATLDKILEADLTYRRALRRTGDILELQDGPDVETPTVSSLSSVQHRLEQLGAYNRKDVVAAYQRLLIRRERGAA